MRAGVSLVGGLNVHSFIHCWRGTDWDPAFREVLGEGVLARGLGVLTCGGVRSSSVTGQQWELRGQNRAVGGEGFWREDARPGRDEKGSQRPDSRPWVAAFSHCPLTLLPAANSRPTVRQVQVEVGGDAGRSCREGPPGTVLVWPVESAFPESQEDGWLLDAAFLLRGSWENLPYQPQRPAPLPEPLVPLDQSEVWVWPGQRWAGLGWAGLALENRVARHKQMNWLIEALVFI